MVEKCVNRHLGILKDRETTINISDLPRRWRMVARRTWTQEGAAGRRGERRGGRPSFRQRTGSPAMSLHGRDQNSVCTRYATRISSSEEGSIRLWRKVSPTKNKKVFGLVRYFWRRGQYIFFSADGGGGHGPRAPPSWLRP